MKVIGLLAILALAGGQNQNLLKPPKPSTASVIDQQVTEIQKQVADLESNIERREEYDFLLGFSAGMDNADSTKAKRKRVLLAAINDIRARHHMSQFKTFDEWQNSLKKGGDNSR